MIVVLIKKVAKDISGGGVIRRQMKSEILEKRKEPECVKRNG